MVEPFSGLLAGANGDVEALGLPAVLFVLVLAESEGIEHVRKRQGPHPAGQLLLLVQFDGQPVGSTSIFRCLRFRGFPSRPVSFGGPHPGRDRGDLLGQPQRLIALPSSRVREDPGWLVDRQLCDRLRQIAIEPLHAFMLGRGPSTLCAAPEALQRPRRRSAAPHSAGGHQSICGRLAPRSRGPAARCSPSGAVSARRHEGEGARCSRGHTPALAIRSNGPANPAAGRGGIRPPLGRGCQKHLDSQDGI